MQYKLLLLTIVSSVALASTAGAQTGPAADASKKAKLEQRFKAADKDGDGALTKEEAAAGKMPMIVKNFDQIDVDKDGKVTPDELRTYMRNRRGHAASAEAAN